jgi:uncharacterized protein YukJ
MQQSIINVQDSENRYKDFVNVLSYDGSFLEYVQNSNWTNPLKSKLQDLELGSHEIESQPDGLALDYIRSGIADIESFTGIPKNISISDSDLTKLIDHYVQRTTSDDNSMVYIFGSAFKDENESDLGVHDVHMNQGNPDSDRFARDN